jgi:hypothetical protein
LKIVFTEWGAGHHGPFDPPGALWVTDENQASSIMEVLRLTLHHGESIKSNLLDEKGRLLIKYEVDMELAVKVKPESENLIFI